MEHGQWRLIPVADCTEKLIAECYMLLCIHFENITLTEFRSDLAEKEMIALLETTAGVRGFSTLMTVTPYVAHARRHIVFSGDTVVDPVYRNSFGVGSVSWPVLQNETATAARSGIMVCSHLQGIWNI